MRPASLARITGGVLAAGLAAWIPWQLTHGPHGAAVPPAAGPSLRSPAPSLSPSRRPAAGNPAPQPQPDHGAHLVAAQEPTTPALPVPVPTVTVTATSPAPRPSPSPSPSPSPGQTCPVRVLTIAVCIGGTS